MRERSSIMCSMNRLSRAERARIIRALVEGNSLRSTVLRGVIDREGAEIGVLVSFEGPTAGMRAEAASAGFYESPWGKHPRLQLRTVGELLAGQGIDYPHVTGANVTHRRAVRAAAAHAESLELFAAEAPEPYGSDEAPDSN